MADEIVKKYKVHRVSGTNSDGSAKLETVHPETEAGQVLYTGTIGTTDVANVDQALGALAAISGVTGVKGAAESTYRTRNVNLTPANIGAVASNTAISGGTFTSITFDSKGLVTGGSEATLDNIPDGTTRKIPTDYIPISQKGVEGGVATLGNDGKVLNSQLPSYVDDVLDRYIVSGSDPLSSGWLSEKSGGSATAPETGKIYVVLSSGEYINKTYRWSGTSYVEISASLVIGTEAGNAFDGKRGVDLEDAVNKIKNGNITVGKATDADNLGGKPASQYALADNVSDLDDLFVVEGSQDAYSKVVSIDKTYTEIKNAINDLKIPILHLHDPDYDTDYAYQYVSYQTDDIEILRFICIDGTTYRSVSIFGDGRISYSSNTLIDNVTDNGAGENGTGVIVSKIEKSGSAVSVTRRAMQVTDLPTPVYDEETDATYSLVSVNSKGQVTGGNQLIEWGIKGQENPSTALALNGLFFELVE